MEFTPSQEERKSFAFNAKLFILDAITLLLVLPGYGILKNEKITDNSLRTRFQFALPDGKLCLPKGGTFCYGTEHSSTDLQRGVCPIQMKRSEFFRL